MRSVELAALGITTIAGSFFVLGTQPSGIVGLYRETLVPTMFALWLSGFFAATLSPPTVSVVFWLLAKRSRYGWAMHILLVPTIFVIVRGCLALMLFAADEPDSDGLTGWAIDPAFLLMAICPTLYFCAVGFEHVGRFRRSANGS
jgi:hypothetical protein